MKLSNRVNSIEASGIRKVFEKAMTIGPKAINLSIGQPHFPASPLLKQYATQAINDNFNTYMPTKGYMPLREKIATKLKEDNGIDARTDDVIVTSGVSGALYLLFASVLDEGDEVILPDPFFVLYEQILKYFNVKIVYHDTYPDFRLHPEKIESLITSKTKLIIVNSPNNPTGMVYSKEELQALADIARKHNILIMSDEIYEAFDYGKKFFSIGSIYENTVTLNGFSKNLSVTGWRVGYTHGPCEIIEAMNKLQMYTYICSPSISQKAISEAMDKDLEIFDYTANRDYLYDALKDKFELNKPEGAFYAFIKSPYESEKFFNDLMQQNVLVVPGNVFSKRDDYFRLSFAVDGKILEKGVNILLQ